MIMESYLEHWIKKLKACKKKDDLIICGEECKELAACLESLKNQTK